VPSLLDFRKVAIRAGRRYHRLCLHIAADKPPDNRGGGNPNIVVPAQRWENGCWQTPQGMLPTHAWSANLPQDALQASGLPHLKLPSGEPAQMAHLRGLALRTALKPARPRMRPFNIHLLERMLSHPGLHGEFISVRGLENRASFGRYYSNRCCSPMFYLSYAYHMPLCAGGRELRGIYPASFLLNRRGVWRSPIAVARFFAAATASQGLPITCRL